MIETYLFFIIAVVAIAAAAGMLLSDNAVHSALFLILNFACVAFFFLMLDAPFLAMVQLAVYAGAIMVLFLFVIMLLGAEQAEPRITVAKGLPGSRRFTYAAAVLGVVLFLVVGIAMLGDTVDTLEPVTEPSLRLVHGAASVDRVNIDVDGVTVAEELLFGESSRLLNLPVGEHEVAVTNAETGEPVISGSIALEAPAGQNIITTAVVYQQYADLQGTTAPTFELTAFEQDMNPPPNREARVLIFNGAGRTVSLQDTGVFNRAGDSTVLVSELAPGAVSEPVLLEEGTYRSWRFVRPEDEMLDENEGTPLFSIPRREIERNSAYLFVLTSLPNTEFPGVRYLSTETLSTFGSPQAVGEMLFIEYVLPMQLVALVLLAALVGVILIAQKQVAPDAVPQRSAYRPVRRRVSRPLTSVIANQVNADLGDDQPRLGAGGDEQPAGD